jgi:hypothetical protein
MDKSPAERSNELFHKVETATAGLHGLADLMMACDPERLEDESILNSLGHLLRIVAQDLFTHADKGSRIKFPPISPPPRLSDQSNLPPHSE